LSLLTSLQLIKSSLLDLLLPLRCLGCGKEGSLLCPSCCESLPRVRLPLCQRCGSTSSEDALIRVRDAVPQARTKSALERRQNVKDAFACKQGLEGKQILLIDDVCTTGATLDSCATALKSAGASSTWGLTVAREMFSLPQC